LSLVIVDELLISADRFAQSPCMVRTESKLPEIVF